MKLRHKAKVKHQGKIIRRNIYSHYVSNNNPIYCRINNKTHLLNHEFDNELQEIIFYPCWEMKTNKLKTR